MNVEGKGEQRVAEGRRSHHVVITRRPLERLNFHPNTLKARRIPPKPQWWGKWAPTPQNEWVVAPRNTLPVVEERPKQIYHPSSHFRCIILVSKSLRTTLRIFSLADPNTVPLPKDALVNKSGNRGCSRSAVFFHRNGSTRQTITEHLRGAFDSYIWRQIMCLG